LNRIELSTWCAKNKNLTDSERRQLEARRATLQRDILKWSFSQHEHMPWIKFARTHDDYSFAKLKYDLAHPISTSSSPHMLVIPIHPQPTDQPLISPSPHHMNNISASGTSHAIPAGMDPPRVLDIDNDLSNVENVANTLFSVVAF
jgi:hypothetical protein